MTEDIFCNNIRISVPFCKWKYNPFPLKYPWSSTNEKFGLCRSEIFNEMLFSVTIVEHPYSWWSTVITLSTLHSLSPPPGQEYATFSDKEVWPLLEHYCCQSILCVDDGSGRKDWKWRTVGFKLCVPGVEWVAQWDNKQASTSMWKVILSISKWSIIH